MAGKYYEELEVGAIFRHEVRRTVTETDNLLFSCLTMNPQPLHLDEEFGKSSIYGSRIVNSLFTLALVGGLTVTDTTLGTTLGNLGYESITFPAPVRHGDTIRAETTVVDKRESKSRPDAGIVWFEHRGFNQHGDEICTCRRVGLMMRRSVPAGIAGQARG